LQIRTILAPTDFSPASDGAVRYAVDLAARLGARVILLHAFGPPIIPVLEGAVIPTPAQVTDLIVRAGEQLEEVRRQVTRGDVSIETKVVQGAAATAIVDAARDFDVDLVVVGTHGRTGWRHLALGSVAERVVRTAAVPVLTIRGDEQSAAPATLARY